jgi:hypothetical protein
LGDDRRGGLAAILDGGEGMNQQGLQVWNERRAVVVGALTSKALRRSVLVIVPLALVAMVIDRHVTHPGGYWKIILCCAFGLSGVIADEIGRARGKGVYGFNAFYLANYTLWYLGFQYPEFSASSPVMAILWCVALVASGAATGFTSTKDRVASVFDARDWLSLSFAALAVVICAVFFGVAWWSRTWIAGTFSVMGVLFVVGFPLCVIAWYRLKARTGASSGLGIQV